MLYYGTFSNVHINGLFQPSLMAALSPPSSLKGALCSRGSKLFTLSSVVQQCLL